VEIAHLRGSRDAKGCLHCLFRRDAPRKPLSVRGVQFPMVDPSSPIFHPPTRATLIMISHFHVVASLIQFFANLSGDLTIKFMLALWLFPVVALGSQAPNRDFGIADLTDRQIQSQEPIITQAARLGNELLRRDVRTCAYVRGNAGINPTVPIWTSEHLKLANICHSCRPPLNMSRRL
jgi:hypothetical protein